MKSQVGMSATAAMLALFAHVPCCGPSILLLLGGASSGLTFLHRLEPFRPYLIALSILQLGVGFWLAYRMPHQCHKADCNQEAHTKRRVKIGVTWVVASFVLAATVAPALIPHKESGEVCLTCGHSADHHSQDHMFTPRK